MHFQMNQTVRVRPVAKTPALWNTNLSLQVNPVRLKRNMLPQNTGLIVADMWRIKAFGQGNSLHFNHGDHAANSYTWNILFFRMPKWQSWIFINRNIVLVKLTNNHIILAFREPGDCLNFCSKFSKHIFSLSDAILLNLSTSYFQSICLYWQQPTPF